MVDRFPAHPVKIFGARLDDKIGCGYRREAIGGARTTEKAVEYGFFEISGPFQATFLQGSQKGKTPAGNTGFMSRGSENRARRLAKSATVALANTALCVFRPHLITGNCLCYWLT